MCYQVVELYSACGCLYYQHPIDRCAGYGQHDHLVQKRSVLVGHACPEHNTDTRAAVYTSATDDNGSLSSSSGRLNDVPFAERGVSPHISSDPGPSTATEISPAVAVDDAESIHYVDVHWESHGTSEFFTESLGKTFTRSPATFDHGQLRIVR
ncbi:hypothetical protein CTRI78_v004377 [Colletotrichum trifolii]|uniref:Uncharacterized protein n=1 Tax=Colletotrichum trifolii TaxID=5466 RepID=A0A4R8RH63_COLTR|nr:hypothetical protein CTRI78_v004377 [Colletotrichum trifolii]